jgi:hypothetical protein
VLVVGAAAGALMSAWHMWAGLLFSVALLLLAGTLALQGTREPQTEQRPLS